MELEEQAASIAQQSPLAAIRLVESAYDTAWRLARSPGLGRRWDLSHTRLDGLRWFRVRDFPKHLLFYIQTPDGILVARLLHAARDLPRSLREE